MERIPLAFMVSYDGKNMQVVAEILNMQTEVKHTEVQRKPLYVY